MRRRRTLDDAVKLIHCLVADKECSSIMKVRKRTAKIDRKDILATLADIGTWNVSYLAHTNKDVRNVLALQSFKIVQDLFQTCKYDFPLEIVLLSSSLDSVTLELISLSILIKSVIVASINIFTSRGTCKQRLQTARMAHVKQSVLAWYCWKAMVVRFGLFKYCFGFILPQDQK